MFSTLLMPVNGIKYARKSILECHFLHSIFESQTTTIEEHIMDNQGDYYSYFYRKLTSYLEHNPVTTTRQMILDKVRSATNTYMRCRTEGKEPAEAFSIVLDILYEGYTVNTDIIY